MNPEVRKRIEDLEIRVTKLEALFQTKPEVMEKKMSMREFILSKAPKTDDQKTLVIGYFLEKYDGLPSFNVKDLRDGFAHAKESFPSNINQMVNENIKKGYMMEAEEKKDNYKAWTLTNSGEKFVDNNLKEG